MKLVDIDQTIFIPVVDETHGGVTVEMKMTVGEFFRKFCKGFEPETVEAIPVTWLEQRRIETSYNGSKPDVDLNYAFCAAINEWMEEQDAEHPEPVYPTWGEWLIQIGVAQIGSGMLGIHPTMAVQPIPADIAQKLGLKPKEV